ncbi:MAG: cob(I)yrinic acid a,c-diamide adenosyltransferase [bacterium]|nr:cob(I)yrinic acid a,c-diamide adenosyltransferase [bacterium]
MELGKRLVQVYTGAGKGKTTAALGQVIRAAGHGFKSYFFMFLKSEVSIMGEIIALDKFQDLIKMECFDIRYDIFKKKSRVEIEIICAACSRMMRKVREKMKEDVDIIVLDEVNCAVNLGYIREEEVINLIKEKPKNIELILTGRNATQEIIKMADLVTEMLMIKHPYTNKVVARKGIEY